MLAFVPDISWDTMPDAQDDIGPSSSSNSKMAPAVPRARGGGDFVAKTYVISVAAAFVAEATTYPIDLVKTR